MEHINVLLYKIFSDLINYSVYKEEVRLRRCTPRSRHYKVTTITHGKYDASSPVAFLGQHCQGHAEYRYYGRIHTGYKHGVVVHLVENTGRSTDNKLLHLSLQLLRPNYLDVITEDDVNLRALTRRMKLALKNA